MGVFASLTAAALDAGQAVCDRGVVAASVISAVATLVTALLGGVAGLLVAAASSKKKP